MVFKNLYILVLWTKAALAFEGLMVVTIQPLYDRKSDDNQITVVEFHTCQIGSGYFFTVYRPGEIKRSVFLGNPL